MQFSAIPFKIPTKFFILLERAIFKFIWNNKVSRIAKTILNIKTISHGICISDFKQFYREIVLKTNKQKQTNKKPCMVLVP